MAASTSSASAIGRAASPRGGPAAGLGAGAAQAAIATTDRRVGANRIAGLYPRAERPGAGASISAPARHNLTRSQPPSPASFLIAQARTMTVQVGAALGFWSLAGQVRYPPPSRATCSFGQPADQRSLLCPSVNANHFARQAAASRAYSSAEPSDGSAAQSRVTVVGKLPSKQPLGNLNPGMLPVQTGPATQPCAVACSAFVVASNSQ